MPCSKHFSISTDIGSSSCVFPKVANSPKSIMVPFTLLERVGSDVLVKVLPCIGKRYGMHLAMSPVLYP